LSLSAELDELERQLSLAQMPDPHRRPGRPAAFRWTARIEDLKAARGAQLPQALSRQPAPAARHVVSETIAISTVSSRTILPVR
jgi:hypothetical protein